MRPLALLGCLVLIVCAGCADDAAARREADRAAARAALDEGDPDTALVTAKRSLARNGDDPELALLAGLACLELERFSDALAFAARGLEAPDLDDELAAGLAFVDGKAALGRFRAVADLADWQRANLRLREASAAGEHRDQAALLFVLLQDMHGSGSAARQLEVARQLAGRAPGAKETATVRSYLAQRGIEL